MLKLNVEYRILNSIPILGNWGENEAMMGAIRKQGKGGV